MQEASILKYRLDTKSTLDNLQVYLEGKVDYGGMSQNGELLVETKKLSKAKANQEGIHGIMAWVRSLISAPTVMGNFVDMNRYDTFIYEAHGSIATMLAVNAPDWEILDGDLEPICDTIMLLVQAFMSRLIQNKERESYMGNMQTMETVVQPQRGGIFSRFGRRN